MTEPLHQPSGHGRAIRALAKGWLPSLGLLALLAIVVMANILSARFEWRWDVTPDRRYTLSEATRTSIASLHSDATFVVLLSHGDPLAPTLDELLSSYAARSRRIHIDWVDPDRRPADYLRRERELGISAGRTEQGKVVSDTIVVVAAGQRRYYVTADEVANVDPGAGEVQPRLEHALTLGLRSVNEAERPLYCFTTGHREMSLDDTGPSGISELAVRLEHDDAEVEQVELGPEPSSALRRCRVIVVAAPELALSDTAADRLVDASLDGANLLILGGTVPDQAGDVRGVGLGQVAKSGGILMGIDVIIDPDPARHLPESEGETFFAEVVEHPVTRGLSRPTSRAGLRVLVSVAQSLRPAVGSDARSLLVSGPTAFAEKHLGSDTKTTGASPERGSWVVAMASEMPSAKGGAPRRTIVAPAGLADNRALGASGLDGNRAFVDSACSWLAARPAGTVAMAPRAQRPIGLSLSESDLARLIRYVLIVIPGIAAALGIGTLWARRRGERRSPPHVPTDSTT